MTEEGRAHRVNRIGVVVFFLCRLWATLSLLLLIVVLSYCSIVHGTVQPNLSIEIDSVGQTLIRAVALPALWSMGGGTIVYGLLAYTLKCPRCGTWIINEQWPPHRFATSREDPLPKEAFDIGAFWRGLSFNQKCKKCSGDLFIRKPQKKHR